MIDDAELLRRYAADGDDDAVAEFVQRHLGLVYRAALRRLDGDAAAAAEVTQRVFISAARHVRRLARHETLAGWLFATARNAALDHMRNERRRRRYEALAHAESALLSNGAEQAPEVSECWTSVRPMIDGALEELSAIDREAVLLRFFEGRSFAESGARLRLTENAARMRVDRTLDKLHGLLARRGLSSSTAALGLTLAHGAAAAVPTGLAASVTGSALASVAATSVIAPVAGIFAIMNTSKIAIGMAVLSIAGLSTAVYQNRVTRRLRAEVATVETDRHWARAALRDITARMNAAEQALAAKNQEVVALQAAVKAAVDKKSASPVSASSRIAKPAPAQAADNAGLERMANPEYARLATEKLRAEIGLRYGPLYRMLSLTSEQIAKFEANRIAHEQATMDVWSTAVAQGLSVHDPAVVKLASESSGALDKELFKILGGDGANKFRKFSSSRSALDFVNSVAGNLFYSDAPLSRDQGERLIKLAVENTRSGPSPTNPRVTRYETDWAGLEAAAQSTLAQPQFTVFKALLDSRRLQQQMSTWTTTKSAASGGPTASPKGLRPLCLAYRGASKFMRFPTSGVVFSR